MSTVTYRALKSSICFERRTSFGMGKCSVCVGWEEGGGGWPKQRYANKIFKKTKKPNGDRWVSGIKSSLKFNAMVVIIIFILNYPSQLCVWWKVELCHFSTLNSEFGQGWLYHVDDNINGKCTKEKFKPDSCW